MKLFITSSPCDNDVPAHMHLPCSYFTRNKFVENLKKYWKDNAKCLVITADPYNYQANEEMTFTFHRAFLYHGMIPSKLVLVDERNQEEIKKLVPWSDCIILGGGHVPTQMAFFERMGLRQLLKDYDGIVIGISAGSMNCANTVYSQPEEPGETIDPGYKRYFPGLGLTKYQILPHYQNVKDNWIDGKRLYEDVIYEDSKGQKYFALVDGSYILQIDGKATLYGQSYEVSDGRLKELCKDGQEMELE